MRKTLLFMVTLVFAAGLTACRQEARAMKEAETHLQEGLEQRAAKTPKLPLNRSVMPCWPLTAAILNVWR